MKSEQEIKERILVFENALKKHTENPEDYEESFTESLKDYISLLEWVLK